MRLSSSRMTLGDQNFLGYSNSFAPLFVQPCSWWEGVFETVHEFWYYMYGIIYQKLSADFNQLPNELQHFQQVPTTLTSNVCLNQVPAEDFLGSGWEVFDGFMQVMQVMLVCLICLTFPCAQTLPIRTTRVIFELPHSIQFAHLQPANLEEQGRNILSNCTAVAEFVDWTSFSKDRGTWWHLIFGQAMYWNHVPHCHDLTLQAIIDVNFEDVMPSVLW